MRIKGIISKGVFVALVLTLIPSAGISAQIVTAGSSCKTLNEKVTYLSKTYTCIKSGKKLVWDKGVKVVSSTPTVSPASDFAATADCKLSKPSNLSMDDGPMGSVGFPKSANAFSSIGNIKALILFADFPDVVNKVDLKAPWKKSSIPNAEKLFTYASYGKFNIKVDMSEKIYRISKPSTYYNLKADPSGGPVANAPQPKLDEVISDAIAEADADIDFSQYAFVTVSTPQSPNLALSGASGMGQNPRTFDGVTYKYGDFIPYDSLTPLDKPYRTLNFTHDIGHMMGLMHPYVTGAGQPMTGAWDIMWSFAFQNDFFGWNKWKLDWITDDQVSCLNSNFVGTVTQLISPIGDSIKKNKLIILKTSESTALAIELRRKSPFESLKPSDEGVIVYRVDVTKSQGKGPYTIVSNTSKTIDSQNFRQILGTMKPGQSVKVGGFEISVLQSAAAGDYVSIKKSA